jgi:hypothetical protein
MELETASRMRMRAAAPLNGQPWQPGPQDAAENDADRGGTATGARPSSIRAGRRSAHPEAVPDQRVAIGNSGIAPKAGAFLIEIFGMPAGVLVMDGTRLVFRAAHRAFRELDERCFRSAAHAEGAVHSSWTRFQHRPRPGMRSGGGSR